MASTGKSKAAIKRAQSQTCLGYAEREQSRRSQQKQQKQQAKTRDEVCFLYIISPKILSLIIIIYSQSLSLKNRCCFCCFCCMCYARVKNKNIQLSIDIVDAGIIFCLLLTVSRGRTLMSHSGHRGRHPLKPLYFAPESIFTPWVDNCTTLAEKRAQRGLKTWN